MSITLRPSSNNQQLKAAIAEAFAETLTPAHANGGEEQDDPIASALSLARTGYRVAAGNVSAAYHHLKHH